MNIPTTKEDLLFYIENKIQENIHLDYKDSRALDRSKVTELCKDVSAFANSDGGLIIYGIREDEIQKNYPKELDEGISNIAINKEWLENIISSNISPKIDGIIINQIALTSTTSAYAIKIPKSYRSPHQEGNKKIYYKRYNFKSTPMEHYEVLDILNRKNITASFMEIKPEFKDSCIYIVIENIGNLPITNVNFSCADNMIWATFYEKPAIFKNQVNIIYPKQKFSFIYNFISETYNKEIDISVSYLHPQTNCLATEKFYYNLSDFFGNLIEKTPIEIIGKEIISALKNINASLDKTNQKLASLEAIALPSGLNLSITTLRNLQAFIRNSESYNKFNPEFCNSKLFEEVLQINHQLAHKLYYFFSYHNMQQYKNLADIEEMTPEILENLNKYFNLEYFHTQ